jgi:hypothetical protein
MIINVLYSFTKSDLNENPQPVIHEGDDGVHTASIGLASGLNLAFYNVDDIDHVIEQLKKLRRTLKDTPIKNNLRDLEQVVDVNVHEPMQSEISIMDHKNDYGSFSTLLMDDTSNERINSLSLSFLDRDLAEFVKEIRWS